MSDWRYRVKFTLTDKIPWLLWRRRRYWRNADRNPLLERRSS